MPKKNTPATTPAPAAPDAPQALVEPSLKGRHVIVECAYGGVKIEEATVANAMAYLEAFQSAIPPEVEAYLSRDKDVRHISATLLSNLLKDAGGRLEVGQPFPRLRRLIHGAAPKGVEDPRPEVILTQEMADAALLWSARNGILMRDLSDYEVVKKEVHKHLAFLEIPENAVIVDGDWVFDMAHDLRVIREQRWKEGVPEHRKAARILAFVKENLAPREVTVLEVTEIM